LQKTRHGIIGTNYSCNVLALKVILMESICMICRSLGCSCNLFFYWYGTQHCWIHWNHIKDFERWWGWVPWSCLKHCTFSVIFHHGISSLRWWQVWINLGPLLYHFAGMYGQEDVSFIFLQCSYIYIHIYGAVLMLVSF